MKNFHQKICKRADLSHPDKINQIKRALAPAIPDLPQINFVIELKG